VYSAFIAAETVSTSPDGADFAMSGSARSLDAEDALK
jgi:hypothetical protein